MEQTELDLREILGTLRRRIRLLLAVPAVAVVVAGLLSLFVLDPVYSASTTLWVVKEGTQLNYNELLLNRNLTQTYAEVAKSRAVMRDVIEKLNLRDMSIEGLRNKVTVTPVRNTEILAFKVEHEDPEMAARIADAVAEAFKGQISTFLNDNVAVVDPAIVPTSPIKPRPLLNIALAGVLGAMAAVGIAFLLEYLDTTLKSPEDVTRHLDLPVLGIIPVIEAKGAEVAQRRTRARPTKTSTVMEK